MPNPDFERKEQIQSNAKKRRRRRRLIRGGAAVLIAAVLFVLIFMYLKYRSYDDYTLQNSVDLPSSSEDAVIECYGRGYVQCGTDGLTYFDDTVIWTHEFTMSQPVMDICGDYIAVGDMKQSEVYLFDKSGLYGHVSTQYEILDVEVSESGVVALAASSGNSNYIELKDKDGNELVNIKSVFSSSGYLADITLSDDGTKLAAAFICVTDGSLCSRVLFYDFSGSYDGDDILVATFDQYEGTLVTDVEFMNGNVVCAVGDDTLSFYKFSGTPELITEVAEQDREIQTLYINEKNVLLVVRDVSEDSGYNAVVYNAGGSQVADISFDYSYRDATLSGSNIVLYSTTSLHIISFGGIERFSYTFEDGMRYILPLSTTRYIISSMGDALFVKLT